MPEQPRALEDHWRRIPNETVLELGKITVLAGAIEGIIFSVASWLGPGIHGIADPGRRGVSQVRAALARPGVARAFSDAIRLEDSARWQRWLVDARDALEARNAMIHARMIYVWEGDERVQYARTSRDGLKSPRSIAEIAEVRQGLEHVVEEGDALRLIAIVHEVRDGRRAEAQPLAEQDEY
ncbi:hypothetical protein [Microbacterium aureliae]